MFHDYKKYLQNNLINNTPFTTETRIVVQHCFQMKTEKYHEHQSCHHSPRAEQTFVARCKFIYLCFNFNQNLTRKKPDFKLK